MGGGGGNDGKRHSLSWHFSEEDAVLLGSAATIRLRIEEPRGWMTVEQVWELKPVR